MQHADLEELRACLDADARRLFYYFPGGYAPMILARFAGSGASISDLKRGPAGRLLGHALVRPVVARAGGGRITATDLYAAWPRELLAYRVSLGEWGSHARDCRWNQTTRPGWNLVVRLDFDRRHVEAYRRLVDPDDTRPFEYGGHPVAEEAYTLAWARVDLDLDTGEALIEELQTDWIRVVAQVRALVGWRDGKATLPHYWHRRLGEDDARAAGLVTYADEVVTPHARVWSEAMLTATIAFLVDEVGLRRLYVHDWDSGNRLKGMLGGWSEPPRSLYTRLPRRLCFTRTEEPPRFLDLTTRKLRAARRRGPLAWHRLELP